MQIVTFNVNRASKERMNRIADYLLHHRFDLIVLTEFVPTTHGANLIHQKLTDAGYHVRSAYGVLIASANNLVSGHIQPRWIEVTMNTHDLHVLGVYIPDKSGPEKNTFWQHIVNYAAHNVNTNALLLGDLNSYTKEDSATFTEKRAYNPEELRILKRLGWIDVWEQFRVPSRIERYTWYHRLQVGVRLDYIFMSPRLATTICTVSAYHDATVRKQSKDATDWLSDHSSVVAKLVWPE